MKLSYPVILLLGIVQLVPAQPTNSEILPTEEQLVEFYDKEFNILTGKICLQLKNITQYLLQDDAVQHSHSSLLKDFRTNLTHFQELYPFYLRFGFNGTLAATFSNMNQHYFATEPLTNEDDLYIQELLNKSDYSEIRQKYKPEFMKFFSEKFQPKYEQLKTQILKRPELLKFENKFRKFLDRWEKCETYECYLSAFKKTILTPKNQLFGNIQRHILDKTILFLTNETTPIKAVFTDPRLAQLSPAARQHLNQSLQNTMQMCENITEAPTLMLFAIFHPLIFTEFVDKEEYSSNETQLIRNILETAGIFEEKKLGEAIFDEAFQRQILKEFENFVASLDQQELIEEKFLIERIQRYQQATSSEQKYKILNSIKVLEEEEFKKSRI